MRRVALIMFACAAVALCVGLVGAQEQKSEGLMGKVKEIIPGSEEKGAAKMEGAGTMEKMKGAPPGSEEKGAAEMEGAGTMERVKGVMPGESGK